MTVNLSPKQIVFLVQATAAIFVATGCAQRPAVLKNENELNVGGIRVGTSREKTREIAKTIARTPPTCDDEFTLDYKD